MTAGIDFLLKGGILVWPILLCSLLGTAVFFDRLLCFRRARDRDGVAEKVLQLLARGYFFEAEKVLKSRRRHAGHRRSAFEFLLQAAVSVQGRDRQTLEMVLNHAVERELDHLSKRMGLLAAAGNISPLLGLLGTVFGMIKAFMVVETLGGRVNAAVLAGGIWEAMLTTAFGLVVAIPLIIFHVYLEGRLNTIQTDLEDVSVILLKNWEKQTGRAGEHATGFKTEDNQGRASTDLAD